jgi:hypothetical protein
VHARTGLRVVGGDLCADHINMKLFSGVRGEAIAVRSSGSAVINFQHANFVTGDCITGGGAIKGLANATIGGRVDTSGVAPELQECNAAFCSATARVAELSLLPATPGYDLGSLRVTRNRRIPATGTLGAGQVVVQTRSILLGNYTTLTLAGSPDTTRVIVHVSGNLRLGRPAEIALEGLTPEQVIFVVDGWVYAHSFGTVAGTIFAGGNVRIGFASAIHGAVLGQKAVRLGNFTTIDQHPFVGW